MSRFLLAFLALILALLYAALSPAVTSRFEPFDFSINASTRVLLVTAHPDDECMFFAPTILTLVARKVEVHSLCLSVGDQDGLGDIRRSELEKSLDVLGISKDKRMVVDSPALPDNITVHWDELAIRAFVEPYIISHNITTLITFDAHGISGHPNHASIVLALVKLLACWDGSIAKPSLYSLYSVGLASKYIGPAALIGRRIIKLSDRIYTRLSPWLPQPALIAVSGHSEYTTAHRAMRQHASQLVWFRYLYVAFSRYMWVNELYRVKMEVVCAGPSDPPPYYNYDADETVE